MCISSDPCVFSFFLGFLGLVGCFGVVEQMFFKISLDFCRSSKSAKLLVSLC